MYLKFRDNILTLNLRTDMKRVCAWCNKDLGDVVSKKSPSTDITHGICSQCAIKITSAGNPRTAHEILNYIREPIFLINSSGKILAANKSGVKMLGKSMDQIENRFGGDVFECSYANVDGGCGRSIHCKTCAIRNIVLDTLSSERGYTNVPAFQSIGYEEDQKVTCFTISTEKIGECILLRIDEVALISFLDS